MTNVAEPDFYRWKAVSAAELCHLLEGKTDREQDAALRELNSRMMTWRNEELAKLGLVDTAARPNPEPAFYKWKEAVSAELNTLLEGKTPDEQFAALKAWEAGIVARREQLLDADKDHEMDVQRH